VAEVEPFYRVAVEQTHSDADLYEVWAESLQARGQVDAAAEALQRAKDLNAGLADGKTRESCRWRREKRVVEHACENSRSAHRPMIAVVQHPIGNHNK
jgi:hypothetical protein